MNIKCRILSAVYSFLVSWGGIVGLSTVFGQITPTPSVMPTPQAPSVETLPYTYQKYYRDDASYLVTLEGKVNSQGLPTTAWFEWGTSIGIYTSASTTQDVGSSFNDVYVNTNIEGKVPEEPTVYYHRLVAQNSAGTSYGRESRFQLFTLNEWPTVLTEKATDVTSDSATLNGTVRRGRFPFSYFEYGTTSGTYTNEVIAGGEETVTAKIDGLSPATTYYYRLYAMEKIAYWYGNEESFVTLSETATPVTTPTPECEVKSMEVLPKRLRLRRGEHGEVIVTLKGDNCVPEGETVTATIGRVDGKRISVSSMSEITDEHGDARFTITAKNRVGSVIVIFTADSLKKSITVKVRISL